MKERTQEKMKTYLVGGIAGAVIVLIGGFWIGPLTTNGALRTAVDAAIVMQQAEICAQRGRADPAYVDATTFMALDYRGKQNFTTHHAEFEGQTTRMNRDVRNACSTMLGST